jgi:hypothetical protein|nr:MAG TPA: penicillin-binding protein [Inoviridae sp.]
MKKILIAILPIMLLFMFIRTINNKDPFISTFYLSEYFENIDLFSSTKETFEDLKQSIDDLKLIIRQFNNKTKDNTNTLDKIKELIISIWNFFVVLINVIITLIKLVIAVVVDLVDLGFITLKAFEYVLTV